MHGSSRFKSIKLLLLSDDDGSESFGSVLCWVMWNYKVKPQTKNRKVKEKHENHKAKLKVNEKKTANQVNEIMLITKLTSRSWIWNFTFKNFLLSLDTRFACGFDFDWLPLVNIAELRLTADLPKRLWVRLWIASCRWIDLKKIATSSWVCRVENLMKLTFGGLIGVFDCAVVPRLVGNVSSSSASSSTSFGAEMKQSSIKCPERCYIFHQEFDTAQQINLHQSKD